MRTLSANLQGILNANHIELFYLLRIYKQSGTSIVASTTYVRDLTMSNGITYAADDRLVNVDPPQLTTTVDREQYKITLADPDFSLGAHAETGLVGSIMETRIGFIEPVSGLPFSSIADTFVVYKGKVDSVGYTVNTSEFGEANIQIIGVSPMLSLEMKKGLFLSRDYIRQQNINDSCCDQIYEGSTAVVLKWGKP